MIFAIVGILIGIFAGLYFPVGIPVEYTRYSAIVILGILDSVLGALRADIQHQYSNTIFISGLIFNMLLAVAITYLGDQLNLDLYLAAIIVFTIRIFTNLSTIRYLLLERILGKKRVEHEIGDKLPANKN